MSDGSQPARKQLAFTLLVLFGINLMNFYDRQILGVVGEKVRLEWGLNDKVLGSLGTAFILLYAMVGVPLGHWVDRGPRTRIIAGGVTLWSLMTWLSALAWNVPSMFLVRMGVGVGEASCAPAASSLLGDLFPKEKRARAMSLFMLGLPFGLSLSSIMSGWITDRWGWRASFWVAGILG